MKVSLTLAQCGHKEKDTNGKGAGSDQNEEDHKYVGYTEAIKKNDPKFGKKEAMQAKKKANSFIQLLPGTGES